MPNGEGLAQNTSGAGPERKSRPSREQPDAEHWQRAKEGSSEYLSTNAGLKAVDNLKAEA
ncbi:hypothetical protein CDL32_23140 [Escherichia coli]|nr:hypothetical protein CDL32_23140 [Escherichia coli]